MSPYRIPSLDLYERFRNEFPSASPSSVVDTVNYIDCASDSVCDGMIEFDSFWNWRTLQVIAEGMANGIQNPQPQLRQDPIESGQTEISIILPWKVPAECEHNPEFCAGRAFFPEGGYLTSDRLQLRVRGLKSAQLSDESVSGESVRATVLAPAIGGVVEALGLGAAITTTMATGGGIALGIMGSTPAPQNSELQLYQERWVEDGTITVVVRYPSTDPRTLLHRPLQTSQAGGGESNGTGTVGEAPESSSTPPAGPEPPKEKMTFASVAARIAQRLRITTGGKRLESAPEAQREGVAREKSAEVIKEQLERLTGGDPRLDILGHIQEWRDRVYGRGSHITGSAITYGQTEIVSITPPEGNNHFDVVMRVPFTATADFSASDSLRLPGALTYTIRGRPRDTVNPYRDFGRSIRLEGPPSSATLGLAPGPEITLEFPPVHPMARTDDSIQNRRLFNPAPGSNTTITVIGRKKK